jgi:hypothetical protein
MILTGKDMASEMLQIQSTIKAIMGVTKVLGNPAGRFEVMPKSQRRTAHK